MDKTKTKTCARCGRTFPIEEFALVFHKGRNKFYRNSYCKECLRTIAKEYYKRKCGLIK